MKNILRTSLMVLACVIMVAPAALPDSTDDLIGKLKHADPKVRMEAAQEFCGG
ncbi:MAG: hypothetical protein V1792_29785 [Pseudomonadota bacterium]